MATAPTTITFHTLILKDAWGNKTIFDMTKGTFYSESQQKEHPLTIEGTGDVLTMDLGTMRPSIFRDDVLEFDLRDGEPVRFTRAKGEAQ